MADSQGTPSMSSIAAFKGMPSMSSTGTPSRGSQPMGQPSMSSTGVFPRGSPSRSVLSSGAPSISQDASYRKTHKTKRLYQRLQLVKKKRTSNFLCNEEISSPLPSLCLRLPLSRSPKRHSEAGLDKAGDIWPSLPRP